MMRPLAFIVFAATVASSLPATAQVSEKKTLTTEGARRVLAAVVAEAKKRNTTGAIAIVDDGGFLLVLERLDNTFQAGPGISIGKAKTAALFRKSTKFFEDLINKGRTAMTALQPAPDFTPLQGGEPLVVDGQIVGAVGVSGASSAAEDTELALVAVEAAKNVAKARSESGCGKAVAYVEASRVGEAFAKGQPLLETAEYKIHASRRESAGLAEVHTQDTDIIHVLDGAATLVTGGSVVDGKNIAAEEIRGASITGGEARVLAKGDVIVVPAGTPHWFKEVKGPLTYYVVKVSSAACAGACKP